MSKSFHMLLVLATLSLQLLLVLGSCNVCQQNGAACINQTAYNLCFGGSKPNTAQTFVCDSGLVCSDAPTICYQRSKKPASCGDTDSCGQCNADNVFACTSYSTFAFCFGATIPTNVTGSCPIGRFCDASSTNICEMKVTDNSIICNLN